MKKILLFLITLIIPFLGINDTFAEGDEGNSGIKVYISIDFSSIINVCSKDDDGYYCIVPKGIGGFSLIMAGGIKYITFIASLAGVLFIVVNGIMYSMGGANDSLKTESKKRIVQTLIGLILLLMSGVILRIVAPWVYL